MHRIKPKVKPEIDPKDRPIETCLGCGRPTKLLYCDSCAPPPLLRQTSRRSKGGKESES
jgi:hypothetical protein